jgi:hypothetical protein
MRRHVPTLVLLSALALLLTACGSGEVGQEATAEGAPTATPSRSIALPTPEPDEGIEYVILDPAFDPVPGARAVFGIENGAAYQIEVPDDWNRRVVYYAHGFRGFGPDLFVNPPFIRQHLIENGYAWAASSYRQNGYVPAIGAEDTVALRDIIEREVGTPERSYIYGTSLGGHVVVLSLELYPNVYDGALAECGVMTGVEILDFFASYALVAEFVSGVQVPLDAELEELVELVRTQILPTLGSPENLTERGRQFESIITNLTGGPRPWRREGFAGRYEANLLLAVQGAREGGLAARAASNADTVYHIGPSLGLTDDEVNSGVRRLRFDPEARDPEKHPEFAGVSGKLEESLLSIHTTGDFFVPFSLQQSYRRKVEAAGDGDLLVQRAIRRPGHCQFTVAEQARAFDDLVRWVEEGVRPEGDDVLAPDLSEIGLDFTDPLLPGDPGGM